jgi:hypothetical protein
MTGQMEFIELAFRVASFSRFVPSAQPLVRHAVC